MLLTISACFSVEGDRGTLQGEGVCFLQLLRVGLQFESWTLGKLCLSSFTQDTLSPVTLWLSGDVMQTFP